MPQQLQLLLEDVPTLQSKLLKQCVHHQRHPQEYQHYHRPRTGMELLIVLYDKLLEDLSIDTDGPSNPGPGTAEPQPDTPHRLEPLCAAVVTSIINANGAIPCVAAYPRALSPGSSRVPFHKQIHEQARTWTMLCDRVHVLSQYRGRLKPECPWNIRFVLAASARRMCGLLCCVCDANLPQRSIELSRGVGVCVSTQS